MKNHELLSNFDIFSTISSSHLAKISQYLEEREFDVGDIIFHKGDEALHLYGVLSGEVDLVLVVEDEILQTDVRFEEYTRVRTEVTQREVVVDTIGQEEIFGWSAMTSSGLFTSGAVCSSAAKVIALPADRLKTFFHEHPQVGYPFMERLADVISQRLANRTAKLLEGWVEAFAVDRV